MLYKHAIPTPASLPHIPAKISKGAQGRIKPGKMAIETKSQKPFFNKKDSNNFQLV